MSLETKRRTATNKIELVETHNLSLALRRLRDAAPYDSDRWKRALVHALGIACAGTYAERKTIREALGLP